MNSHGGTRAGSGRKRLDPVASVVVGVRLSRIQHDLFNNLGGAKWLRSYLQSPAVSKHLLSNISRPSVTAHKSKAVAKTNWFPGSF